MTKRITLTQDYISFFFNGEVLKGEKIQGKYHFFNYTPPPNLSGGESYKFEEFAANPDKVPIYDKDGKLLRTEAITINIACIFGDVVTVSTAIADKWLKERDIANPIDPRERIRIKFFEEVYDY